ncbi:hypothetical protein Pst134EA_006893 [Puccinia striiformis f. sp. tritici]|uniref:hypothetical protein n=1 Tax=Puccinia striiformis f. sp. tritici TaxID=168172 RepID=UPI0020084317|nr:hypothetical protein Pst134EA_006893 [Puccinia striiformis f. sp. tritici]KAH9469600.1 hypothetical protein Pst134EA_006893 [Puccinia striiformis f. sp. tritici]
MLSTRLILLSVWLFSTGNHCVRTVIDPSIASTSGHASSDFFDTPARENSWNEAVERPSAPKNHLATDHLSTTFDERRGKSPHQAELQTNSLADNLMKQFPEGYTLTPEMRSKINGLRDNNDAIRLDQDVTQFSALESRIDEIFRALRTSNQDQRQVSDIKTASDLLRELQRKTKTFTQLRIISLAGPESEASYLKLAGSLLPSTPLTIFEARQGLQKAAGSILDTWTELLTKDNLHAEFLKSGLAEVDWINTWRYAFRAVDLLHKNGFIRPTKLQSFLKDEGVAKLVLVSYINWLWDNRDLSVSELYRVFNLVITDKTNALDTPFSKSVLLFKRSRAITGPRSFEDAVISGFPLGESTLNHVGGSDSNKIVWDYDHISRLANMFHTLIPQLTELKSWSPEMRLKMVENWVQNSGEVTALERDLTKLSTQKNNLDVSLGSIVRGFSEFRYPSIKTASLLVEDCHRGLKTLTVLSLSKLGRSRNSGLKSKDELDNVGGAILQDVKRLVTMSDLRAEFMGLWNGEESWFNTCKFAFAAVDSLVGSGFVNPTRISSLLQEEEVSNLVVSHIYYTWWRNGWPYAPYETKAVEEGSWPMLDTSILSPNLGSESKDTMRRLFEAMNSWGAEKSQEASSRARGEGPWPKLNHSFKYLDAQTKKTVEQSFEEFKSWAADRNRPRPSCFKELDERSRIETANKLKGAMYDTQYKGHVRHRLV